MLQPSGRQPLPSRRSARARSSPSSVRAIGTAMKTSATVPPTHTAAASRCSAANAVSILAVTIRGYHSREDRMSRLESLLQEFKTFVLRGNVVDLAVAFVIGAAFTAVVTAVVNDWVTPLVGAIFGGKGAFGDLTFTL